MEIRRKVFSLLVDQSGEERLYSTTEFKISVDEETEDSLFSEKSEDKKLKQANSLANAALGTGAAATVAGGGMFLRAKRKLGKVGEEYIKNNPGAVEINTFYNKPMLKVSKWGGIEARGIEGIKHAQNLLETEGAKKAGKLGKAGGIVAAAGLLTAAGAGVGKLAINKKKKKKENK